MTKLYSMRCVACEGDDLTLDWPSRWSIEKQDWVIVEDAGEAYCGDCNEYHDTKRVEWHPIPKEVS